MLVTIKDLRQASAGFQMDIRTDETVADLKQRIQTERGAEYATTHQCLIYAGRILEDARRLEEYSLDEGKFIVLMVKRQPVETKRAAASEESSTSSSGAASAAPVPMLPKPDPPAAAAQAAEPNMLAVAHIVEMGYTRPEALDAMRRCNNHSEHAIEFLLTGEIPATYSSLSSAENPLQFLSGMPEFQHIRQLVRSDPQQLSTWISQIAETRPELIELIRGNVQHFVELLSEGMLEDVEFPLRGLWPDGVDGQQEQQDSEDYDGDDGEDVAQAIELTPAERQAVQYLMELGFTQLEAEQAYMAFEKNEHLAAEFLLEQRELNGTN